MAEYLGVQGGLMVKQVARKSEAAAAGLKAFDVILKVGTDSITTSADWDRALRSNVGKPVQVTILRDKKQQTLTLQVDSKHRGAVDVPRSSMGSSHLPAPSCSRSIYIRNVSDPHSPGAAFPFGALRVSRRKLISMEVLYGLHPVEEALKAGTPPLRSRSRRPRAPRRPP